MMSVADRRLRSSFLAPASGRIVRPAWPAAWLPERLAKSLVDPAISTVSAYVTVSVAAGLILSPLRSTVPSFCFGTATLPPGAVAYTHDALAAADIQVPGRAGPA